MAYLGKSVDQPCFFGARPEIRERAKALRERLLHEETRRRHEETRRKKVYMEFDILSKKIIGSAIEVHKFLGPGLLESAYEFNKNAEGMIFL